MNLLLKEAAALLGIQPATLRQQIKNGRFSADKVGRDWQTTTFEIRRYARDSQNRELP